MQKISLVVPTYNEEGNIEPLVKRIDKALRKHNIIYEIIFIDDNSSDLTRDIIDALSSFYPISLFVKKGKKGKAFSLLEGFSYAKYGLICMIDGDMQYPPEAIPKMMDKLSSADIIIANRKEQYVQLYRKILSKVQQRIFNRWLHHLSCDVQSGLKVFKKEIIERITISSGEWTFDLAFLLKAKQAGYSIDTVDITFSPRYKESSKVSILKTSTEIAFAAIKLKFEKPEIIPFHPKDLFKKGKGFHYKGSAFIHHSDLDISESAFFRLTPVQQRALILIGLTLFFGLVTDWHTTVIFLLSILTFFYFTDLLFNLFLIMRNFYSQPEISIEEKELQKKHVWPRYTVLCPLYKEANVLPQFINAMSSLNYPHEKLQVILLLEADDSQTIKQAKQMKLSSYFEIVIVPNSFPKTKPKALNFGITAATGEYTVIYDAEDMPDTLQLKKVALAFEKADTSIGCIQAKLNFYNPHQNLLTKLFTAEYSLWFDLVLTGLQSLDAPIPLGGTSNHFRTEDLIRLKGWDSFNVTEDCDLGIRLVREGYQTAIVNSTTFEEANSSLKNWFPQRGRWIKGYIQSYFVHIRNPRLFLESAPISKFIIFQLVVGGKILSLFINPLMWAITFSYFAFRPFVGAFIQSLFPPYIFYIGILSLVFGNFLYMYYYMIAAIKREHFSITKYAFLVPFYWLGMSIAAWLAVYKMIFQPHYWAKTTHGLHLKNQSANLQSMTIDERPTVQPAL